MFFVGDAVNFAGSPMVLYRRTYVFCRSSYKKGTSSYVIIRNSYHLKINQLTQSPLRETLL